MKKILFAVALSLFTANVIAQTPEEKAAEKAAKEAAQITGFKKNAIYAVLTKS